MSISLDSDPSPRRHNHRIGTCLSFHHIGSGGCRVPVLIKAQRASRAIGNPDTRREMPDGTFVRIARKGICPIKMLSAAVDLKEHRGVGRNGVHPPPLQGGFQQPGASPQCPLLTQPENVRNPGRKQNACARKDNHQFHKAVAPAYAGFCCPFAGHEYLMNHPGVEPKNLRRCRPFLRDFSEVI